MSDRSLYNFTTSAKMIAVKESASLSDPVNYSFKILNSVRQEPGTKWSIVYDISEMKVYLKVFETPLIMGEQKIFMKHPGVSKIKIVEVDKFNFDCTSEPLVLDIEYDAEGIVNNDFINYSTMINKEYISKAFTFFEGWGTDIQLNEEKMEYLSKYPESFICIDKSGVN